MNHRSASSSLRSPEARIAAACSSVACAYFACGKTTRATSDKHKDSNKNSNHSGAATACSSSNTQKKQPIASRLARAIDDKASRT